MSSRFISNNEDEVQLTRLWYEVGLRFLVSPVRAVEVVGDCRRHRQ